MKQISVLVSKTATTGFHATPFAKTVNCNALIVNKPVFIATQDYNDGTVNSVKAGDEVAETHPAVKKAVLRIEDHNNGTLWVDETFQSFHDKCEACCQ